MTESGAVGREGSSNVGEGIGGSDARRSLQPLPLTGSCGTCPQDTSLSAAPYLREDSRISD